MNKFMKEFCRRGLLFAWLGPVILCIVWYFLKKNGIIDQLDVLDVIRAVLSILVMSFLAAGVSAVYTLEQLPYPPAGLIQMAVLYLDYLLVYLWNGWLPLSALPVYSLIFLTGFGIIWLIIYLTIRRTVERMNSRMHNPEN